MTVEELNKEYATLTEEETQIANELNAMVQEANAFESNISSLKDQATEMDLQISEMPAQVYVKQCTSAFLGFGKTCQEIPQANPAVAGAIVQRNNLIRESNSLRLLLEDKYGQISDLTQRQIEIQQRQVAIRDETNIAEKKLITGPFDFLGSLFGRLTTFMAQEQLQSEGEPKAESVALTAVKKYLPLAAVAGGMLVVFLITKLRRRRRVE